MSASPTPPMSEPGLVATDPAPAGSGSGPSPRAVGPPVCAICGESVSMSRDARVGWQHFPKSTQLHRIPAVMGAERRRRLMRRGSL